MIETFREVIPTFIKRPWSKITSKATINSLTH